MTYIGRVGKDGFGDAIRHRLLGEGVDCRVLTTDPDAATGLMFRERRGLGPSHVVYARAGSAGSRLSPPDVDQAAEAGAFEGARWLHLTGITPALSVDAAAAVDRAIDLARAAGTTISLDLNLRRRLWSDQAAAPVLRELAGRVDVLFGSPDELAVVTGLRHDEDPAVLARTALDLGPAVAVAKLGRDGSLAVDREEPDLPVARSGIPLPVVIDPVGAGDAFCAGFIAARLDGTGLPEALEMGNACGASAAAALGDQTGLPDRATLAAILLSASEAGDPDTIR